MRDIINTYIKTEDSAVLKKFKYQKNNQWDDTYWDRSELIFELYNDFDSTHKALIKWLINEEMKGIEIELPTETLQVCAYMIYKIMDMSDIYDLFNIKFGAGTDLQCAIDTELIFGLDKERTKKYLKENPSEESNEILDCIKHYESFKTAVYRSREEYITYFETRRINMLKTDFEDVKDYLKK
ncbi:hypothetical protein [Aquimarina algicola]|uniref:Uncharacterized protein n=1 Tax=Aquimarina algicola TaxID=2589995 RepID=A0A504J5R1_9FLAO|nr:hypothetical protein [Aquimarina algicola]TPN85864.1 hypothetical protein FHK87_11305 [Aquimarina algicola]